MTTFLLILSVLLVVFSGFLGWQVMEQHKIIARMMAQTMEEDEISALSREPDLLLTLKVLNPIEVAKRESRSARVIADKLPVMVRKMVYQGIMKELEEELAERGIEAEIHLECR